MRKMLQERYGYVFEDALLDEIAEVGDYRQIPADNLIIDIGDSIEFMPLILSGSIKVLSHDDEDRELLLYYLEIGDTCAMTMDCCLSKSKSEIRAITEEHTEIIMVPVQKMMDWLAKFDSWREFVLSSYNTRLREMLQAIDNLAFHNMEERLYKYLEDRAMVLGTPELKITHQKIAMDLNSSRVVVSRLMKKLEDTGKIKHRRNTIEVLKFIDGEDQ
jgi:CRP/FNR family transcriptional regulator